MRHGRLVVELPEGLYGAHTRADLSRVLSPYALRTALADHRLTTFSKEVLIDRYRATEFHTRAAASLLFAGPSAVLGGQSALALHGCTAAETAPIHLLLPYFRKLRRKPGLVTHHGQVDPQDVEELGRLRVLRLDVALAQVLCRSDRRTAIACADQALAMVPEADRAEFRAWTEEHIRTRPDSRGRRRGLVLLDLSTGFAESPMESSLLLTVADAGLPVPAQQFPITNLEGRELYRLDFAWPALRIGLEYDGYEAHEGRQTRDAARDDDLQRRGWLIIRATVNDLKDPGRLITKIRSAFQQHGLVGSLTE
jgi:hypothetical protein